MSKKKLEATFDTGKYIVIVRSEIFRKCGTFRVKTIDKLTLRYSSVCNMNGFMPYFADDDIDNPLYEDSWWVGKRRQARRWFKIAKELLSDNSYHSYFEKLLNDDRLAGEWENRIE